MDATEVKVPTDDKAADTSAEQQLVVHGETLPPPPPRKRLNLLNRPPSPKILEVYGELEPSRCTVHGPGVAGGFVGRSTQVFVTARDAKGVHIREGGHKFHLKLYSKEKQAFVHECDATDHNDGTYVFLFKVDAKGMYELSVYEDGRAVGDSPYGVFFGIGDDEAAPPTFQTPASLAVSASGDIKERIVFVQQVNPAVEAEGVRKIFDACGRITKCERLLPSMDMWTVHFSKPEGAVAAAARDGTEVASSAIKVAIASQCGGLGTHPLILAQLQQIQQIQMQEVVTTQMASMLAAQRAAVRATGGDVEEVTDTRKKRVAMSVIQQLRAKLAKTAPDAADDAGAEERPRAAAAVDLREAARERAKERDRPRRDDGLREADRRRGSEPRDGRAERERDRRDDRDRDRDRARSRDRERSSRHHDGDRRRYDDDRDRRDRVRERERSARSGGRDERDRERDGERHRDASRRAGDREREGRDARRSGEGPERERRERDGGRDGERDRRRDTDRTRDEELARKRREREREREAARAASGGAGGRSDASDADRAASMPGDGQAARTDAEKGEGAAGVVAYDAGAPRQRSDEDAPLEEGTDELAKPRVEDGEAPDAQVADRIRGDGGSHELRDTRGKESKSHKERKSRREHKEHKSSRHGKRDKEPKSRKEKRDRERDDKGFVDDGRDDAVAAEAGSPTLKHSQQGGDDAGAGDLVQNGREPESAVEL